MDKNIDKFYIATQDLLPNDNVKRFIGLNIKPEIAIDLGCGVGRDCIYLLKNGWTVIGVDDKNIEDYITPKLSDLEKLRFKFIQGRFEEIELDQNNLIIANNSLPFCPKIKFKQLWNKIVNSIKSERILCRNFFR